MYEGLKTDYQSFRCVPCTQRIGAELLDIDLTQPLGETQVAELKDALARYMVLFFRDQQIDHDNHKAFGRLFGPLQLHSAVPGIEGHPEIVAIHADADSKYVAGEDWHSDLTCDTAPPLGSAGRCRKCTSARNSPSPRRGAVAASKGRYTRSNRRKTR